MPYSPSKGAYVYIDEQIAFPVSSGHRPKIVLPRKDILEDARKQAEQRQHNLLTHTPSDGLPRVRSKEQTRQDDFYEPRMPTVVRRYDIDTNGQTRQARGTRVENHYHNTPLDTPLVSRRQRAEFSRKIIPLVCFCRDRSNILLLSP